MASICSSGSGSGFSCFAAAFFESTLRFLPPVAGTAAAAAAGAIALSAAGGAAAVFAAGDFRLSMSGLVAGGCGCGCVSAMRVRGVRVRVRSQSDESVACRAHGSK